MSGGPGPRCLCDRLLPSVSLDLAEVGVGLTVTGVVAGVLVVLGEIAVFVLVFVEGALSYPVGIVAGFVEMSVWGVALGEVHIVVETAPVEPMVVVFVDSLVVGSAEGVVFVGIIAVPVAVEVKLVGRVVPGAARDVGGWPGNVKRAPSPSARCPLHVDMDIYGVAAIRGAARLVSFLTVVRGTS